MSTLTESVNKHTQALEGDVERGSRLIRKLLTIIDDIYINGDEVKDEREKKGVLIHISSWWIKEERRKDGARGNGEREWKWRERERERERERTWIL